MTKKYIGSCADDSIGIGTIVVGDKYRTIDNFYTFEVYYAPTDTWIECYDVIAVFVLNEETDILRIEDYDGSII